MLFAPDAVTFSPAIPYSWQVSRMEPANQIDQDEKEIRDEESFAAIHSIRAEVVAHRAAQFGAGDGCRVNWHTRTNHWFPQYTVVDLGPVGPTGQPYTITEMGLVSGEIVLAQIRPCRTLFFGNKGRLKDIGSPGLGGPNSAAFGVNIWGQVVGQADTTTPDPNGEDFCGSKALALTHSGNTCAPFLWQNGAMVALPRLRSSAGTEGSNGAALKMNDFGIAAGTAENGELDSTCPGASISPQSIEFKPVVWTRPFPWSEVHIQELHTVGGDPDGVAFA